MVNKILRDKFLTEAMGKCWHEWDKSGRTVCFSCKKCELFIWNVKQDIDFSTWEGFGELWEWAKKQDFWLHFLHYLIKVVHPEDEYPPDTSYTHYININPTNFANNVYEFLIKKEVI